MDEHAIHPHAVAGVTLIAAERARQVDVKRWSRRHDDDHDDHSLALAACAYAAPEPLYRAAQTSQQGYAFVDCWPGSWDDRYDKRDRHPDTHELIPAEVLPLERRLRNLAKAGALIAAEIDRLTRLQKKGATHG